MTAPKPRTPILAALVGAACAACLAPLTMAFEGKRNTAYLDPVKVLSICYGDTANVRPGQRASDIECMSRLDKQLAAHAAPVLACTPSLRGKPYQLAAAVDLTYTVGAPRYCSSNVDRQFDAGNIHAACDALLDWRFAKGRELPGLVRRRQAERSLCLTGVSS